MSYAEGNRYCHHRNPETGRTCGQHLHHGGQHRTLVRVGLDEAGAVIARREEW